MLLCNKGEGTIIFNVKGWGEANSCFCAVSSYGDMASVVKLGGPLQSTHIRFFTDGKSGEKGLGSIYFKIFSSSDVSIMILLSTTTPNIAPSTIDESTLTEIKVG